MAVGKLSGGEQSRLLLAQLMLRPAQLLVLDEPTNDLDMATLAVLEESLIGFPGAVLLVSHDRYFLDQVATTILAFDRRPDAGGATTPAARASSRSPASRSGRRGAPSNGSRGAAKATADRAASSAAGARRARREDAARLPRAARVRRPSKATHRRRRGGAAGGGRRQRAPRERQRRRAPGRAAARRSTSAAPRSIACTPAGPSSRPSARRRAGPLARSAGGQNWRAEPRSMRRRTRSSPRR